MAGPYASVDFKLSRQAITKGTDLAAYPTGTLSYLTRRGLAVTGTALKVAKAFDGRAVNSTINTTDYKLRVLLWLIRAGYVTASAGSSYTPTVRAATSTYTTNAVNVVTTWPAGTVAGDVVVLNANHGFGLTTPTGWYEHHNTGTATNWNGLTASKLMTAADITAGSVTVSAGGSFQGIANLFTLQGEGASYSSATNATPTGITTVAAVSSLTEQVISDCVLTVPSVSGTVTIDIEIWVSMSAAGGGQKNPQIQLRRTNLAGAVLASSGGLSANVDSTAGHDKSWVFQFVDTAPTDGKYVLTAQNLGLSTSAIYSDTRKFTVGSHRPHILEVARSTGSGNITTQTVTTTGAAAIGDLSLYASSARVSTGTASSTRGTLVQSAGNTNASGAVWKETMTGTGTVSSNFAYSPNGTLGWYMAIIRAR